ncbi:NPC intracellular cholesterol transporter 2-like [Styela clava]
MKLFLVCLLSVFAVASSMNVKFKDCGSKLAEDVVVDVKPCTAEPCSLKQGSNYTISMSFTTKTMVSAIGAKIYGVLGGVPVPFPFDHPDACEDSGLNCPLQNATKATYTATLPIKSEYPAIKLYVKWELVDNDKENSGQDLTCVEIPVAVVASNSVEPQLEFGAHKVKVVRNGNGYW